MSRVIFKNGDQDIFLKNLKLSSNLTTIQLADLCQVSSRTFRDWLRGKYSISEAALKTLSEKLLCALPKDIEVVQDYWYLVKGARKGTLRRMELYTALGTPEGRKKGGINSQVKRKEKPEKYKLLGCLMRKEFKIEQVSVELAEATG